MSFFRFENDDELICEVKSKLGFPIVKVELDESHWKHVVKNTKRWFMAKKSLVAVKFGKYAQNQDPIPFTDIDPVNGVYKVLDVYPDTNDSGSRGVDATYFEILPFGYPIWGSGNHIFGTSAYNRTSYVYQIFMSLEQRRKVYGSDLDFFVENDYINGHKLHLTPQRRCRDYAIVYKPAILPIQSLEGRDAQLFFDWALADAKETLGIIRSKYKDYPSAGGTISTDGPELLDQAKESKERLEEEIAGSQGPLGVIFG